jgi:hypothetical protein
VDALNHPDVVILRGRAFKRERPQNAAVSRRVAVQTWSLAQVCVSRIG